MNPAAWMKNSCEGKIYDGMPVNGSHAFPQSRNPRLPHKSREPSTIIHRFSRWGIPGIPRNVPVAERLPRPANLSRCLNRTTARNNLSDAGYILIKYPPGMRIGSDLEGSHGIQISIGRCRAAFLREEFSNGHQKIFSSFGEIITACCAMRTSGRLGDSPRNMQ